jgi:transcriptional regulator with XRE-family HTH domain
MKSKRTHKATIWLDGDVVQELRKKRFWTQQQLADRSKWPSTRQSPFTKRTIEDIERNKRPVQYDTLRAVASALQVEPDVLMRKEVAPPEDDRALRASPVAVPQTSDLQKDEIWSFDDADVDIDGEKYVREHYISLFWPSIEGAWTSTISGGAYRLTNTGEKDDRHWVVFAPTEEQDPDGDIEEALSLAPVSVEVRVDQQVRAFGAGCGIIYRFREEPMRYYTFVLTADGQIRFAVSRPEGERELYKGRHNAVVSDDFNKLTVLAIGAVFFLYVNETYVAKVQDAVSVRGGLGIVATGTGQFLFRNLTVYQPMP